MWPPLSSLGSREGERSDLHRALGDSMTTQHPCPSLPVTGINVGAAYCVHHQAWSTSVQTWRQKDGEDVEMTHAESMSFGPFDTEEDVRAWMLRAVLAMDDLLP